MTSGNRDPTVIQYDLNAKEKDWNLIMTTVEAKTDNVQTYLKFTGKNTKG